MEVVEIGNNCILYCSDCKEIMPTLSGIHSVVTDPPYHLTSIVKRFGAENAAPAKSAVYKRVSGGFMGQTWDGSGISFEPETWNLAYRTLLPGGHLVAFGGTRTYHRIACAIEDAGFEIRDMLSWLYGTGFPKSHNVGDGWGTALKPGQEPVCLARKPLSEKTVAENVFVHGTGAINIADCRLEDHPTSPGFVKPNVRKNNIYGDDSRDRPTKFEHDYTALGRFPANVMHDGSEEVLEYLGDLQSRFFYCAKATKAEREHGLDDFTKKIARSALNTYNGQGARLDGAPSPVRANIHPTVKPVALMSWLCRLVTPSKGTVLDPFMGSGTTGIAALLQGFKFIGIEQNKEYFDIAVSRIRSALKYPKRFEKNIEVVSEKSTLEEFLS